MTKKMKKGQWISHPETYHPRKKLEGCCGGCQLFTCHGPPRCYGWNSGLCPWCYLTFCDDARTSDEILKDMETFH